MKARFGVGSAIAVACLCAPSAAEAHEPGAYGFGSRGTSMGGAVSADATDFSAGYYNPAGLVAEEGVRIGLGYFYADNTLLINGLDTGVKAAHGLLFGLAAGGKVFGLPFAIGLALHIPDEGLSRITALRQDVPRWELYDSRSTVLYLAANLALRPFEFLEIGGGLSFLAATHGRFAISGKADLFAPYDSELRHEIDADLSSVRYPQVGARVHLSETASLALVYRGQTSLDLALDGDIDASIFVGDLEVPLRYELQARTVQAFLPQQLIVGASYRVIPTLRLNFDLSWVNWGAYKNPTARTSAKLTAVLPPNLPIELPGELKPTKLEDPGFSDRIVPRFGVEWYPPDIEDGDGNTVLRLPVRAGYVFERSPVKEQAGDTNFVDADRHTPSIGAGVEIPLLHLTIDAHGAFSFLPERIVLKRSAANLTGDYRAEGRMTNGGITIGGTFK